MRSAATATPRKGSGGGCVSGKSIGKYVFWSLYAIAQCYLFRLYREAYHGKYPGSIYDASADQATQQKQWMLEGFKQFKSGSSGGNRTTLSSFGQPSNAIPLSLAGLSQTASKQQEPREPSGTFNGYPIYKLKDVKEALYSQFHCVGETWTTPAKHKRSKTFHEQSWMYRTCKFQAFCYDTETMDFVVYLDPERHAPSRKDHHYHSQTNQSSASVPHPSPEIEAILEEQRKRLADEAKQVADKNHERNETTTFKHASFFDDTATVYRNHTVVVDGHGKVVVGDVERGKQYGVSLGGINPKWGLVDIQLLKWFPEVRWGPVPGTDGKNNNHHYEVYTLPSSVVMVPFHSLSAENPGHLVWDDLLPMFTMLKMFGLVAWNASDAAPRLAAAADLLPIRYKLPGMERGLWASCDWLDSKKAACRRMLAKFGTLLGTRRSYLRHHAESEPALPVAASGIPRSASKLPRIDVADNQQVLLNLTTAGDGGNNNDTKPKLVCARTGMAGFGSIADHVPMFGHGWEGKDFRQTHNSGRGGHFWEFRNYMVDNLFYAFPQSSRHPRPPMVFSDEIAKLQRTDRTHAWKTPRLSVALTRDQYLSYPPSSVADLGPDEPLLVVFSAFSSERRGGSYDAEAKQLRRAIQKKGGAYKALYGRDPPPGAPGAGVAVAVETHKFSLYTVEAQVQMASRTAVLVTTCGGGAVTATFLPRGSAVMIYYNHDGGIESNQRTWKPARLDWDYFNNMGYVHAHWIPFNYQTGNETECAAGSACYQAPTEANVDVILNNLRRIHQERVRRFEEPQQR